MTHPFPITESKGKAQALPIHIVSAAQYKDWIKNQPAVTRHWLEANDFKPAPAKYCLIPAADGALAGVVCGVDENPDLWSIAHLTNALPPKLYHLEGRVLAAQATQMALGWALASYRFTRY